MLRFDLSMTVLTMTDPTMTVLTMTDLTMTDHYGNSTWNDCDHLTDNSNYSMRNNCHHCYLMTNNSDYLMEIYGVREPGDLNAVPMAV